MMLTRCPACATTFRVGPEQLKARAGKVRCGQCQSQFNALDTLIEENVFPAAPIPAHEAAAQPAAEMAAPGIEEFSGELEEENIPASPAEPEALHAAEEITGPHTESEIPALAEESSAAAATVPGEPYDTAFDAMPDGEKETGPRRWPWAIGIAIALPALLAQAALHYRVELAVLQPALKPTLLAACATLGCEVPLPRHAEFLSIEASDLHPDPQQKGHLLLAASLRNRAPFAQELPAIELTLNDVADRPLIVKDLAPRDYLPKQTDSVREFGVNAEIAVNLTLDVGDVPAAGYRIYLFYP